MVVSVAQRCDGTVNLRNGLAACGLSRGHEGSCSILPAGGLLRNSAPAVTCLRDLLQQEGSLRRVLDRYWRGGYPAAAEKIIEDSMPKEMICGYKPIAEK